MIHILRGGFALCGRPGVPRDWEPRERWVSIDDADDATCRWCRYTAWKEGVIMARKSQPPPSDTDIFPPVEVDPPPRMKPPVKAHAEPPSRASLRVTGCELQTAPDHALVVRISGETEELAEVRRAILRALHPDDGAEPGVVPAVLHETLPR